VSMNTLNSQPTVNPLSEMPLGEDESEINLLDVLIALGQEKLTVTVVTLLAAIAGVVISLITPPTYMARTSIMPAQQGGGASALAGLSGLAGLAELSGMSGAVKSSDQMYIAFMRSQSVQMALIDQLKLKERYGSKNLEEARMSLTNRVSITADKSSGLLVIEAQDGDAEFAAKLANQQVHELKVILSRLAITEAQQRRLYYEQQIAKTKKTLVEVEVRFKEAQQKAGIQVTSMLVDSAIGLWAGTHAQITAKEQQLQMLGHFATLQNPEMRRLKTEIAVLRTQIIQYEKGNQQSGDREKGTFKAKDISPEQQDAAQAYRDLKIQETLLDGFVRQLEVVKIDEAKEGPPVQVLDVARAPEIRAKPERRKLVITYTLTGLILGLVLALLKALLHHAQSTPEGMQRLHDLRLAWGLRGVKL
jgi:tyrosine-protein kinase Etk/Wzc